MILGQLQHAATSEQTVAAQAQTQWEVVTQGRYQPTDRFEFTILLAAFHAAHAVVVAVVNEFTGQDRSDRPARAVWLPGPCAGNWCRFVFIHQAIRAMPLRKLTWPVPSTTTTNLPCNRAAREPSCGSNAGSCGCQLAIRCSTGVAQKMMQGLVTGRVSCSVSANRFRLSST